MSDQSTEDVFFRIGVAEHPEIVSTINSLADSVLEAQARMDQGAQKLAQRFAQASSPAIQFSNSAAAAAASAGSMAESISVVSQASNSAANSYSNLSNKVVASGAAKSMEEFQRQLEQAKRSLKGDVSALTFLDDLENTIKSANQEIVQTGTVSVESAAKLQVLAAATEKLAAAKDKAASGKPSGSGGQVTPAVDVGGIANLAASTGKNVTETQAFAAALGMTESKASSAVNSLLALQEAGSSLRERFLLMRNELGLSAVQFKELDDVAKQVGMREAAQAAKELGDKSQELKVKLSNVAAEGMGSLLQSLKGVVQMQATMGNRGAEDMLKAIVQIEGVFNILRGGVKAIAGASEAWSTYRKIIETSAQLSAAKAAAAGAQVATTAQETAAVAQNTAALAREAAAANANAAAHQRLAAAKALASRSSVGGAVGSAASTAGSLLSTGGAVAGAVGSGSAAVGAVGGGGAAATAAAGGGAAIGATVGAAVAAIAAVGLVLYELGEIATGTSNEVGSVTDSIATWEVKTTAWLDGMTGGMISYLGELGDSVLGFQTALGATAEYAKSVEKTARMEAALKESQIRNDAARDSQKIADDANANRGAEKIAADVERRRATSSDRSVAMSMSDVARSNPGAVSAVESKAAADAAQRLANAMRSVENLSRNNLAHTKEYQQALDAVGNEMRLIDSINQRARGGENRANQLREEQAIMQEANARMVAASQQVAELTKQGAQSTEEYRRAVEAVARETGIIETSQKNIAKLARDQAMAERESAQVRLSSLEQEINKRQQSLGDIDGRREGAAERFADMDPFQRARTLQSLEKARAGGELTRMDRDNLRSIGSEETQRFVQQSVQADAKKFGFDKIASGFDQEKQRVEQEQKALQVQVNDERKIIIASQVDEDRIVKSATAAFLKAAAERDKAIDAKIQDEVARGQAASQRNATAQLQALKKGSKT